MSKYVLVDELYSMIENEFDGVCVYDVASYEAIRDFIAVVDKCTHYEFSEPPKKPYQEWDRIAKEREE